MTGEYGIVRPLPDVVGRALEEPAGIPGLRRLRLPRHRPLFRLGGGRRLRALDLSQNLGSSVWLTTFEWRYPALARDRSRRRSITSSVSATCSARVFYDVGQSYLTGQWSPVVHGVGVGLRIDTALFAFLERADDPDRPGPARRHQPDTARSSGSG